ncbi:Rho-type gtpase-activating protein [Fusarium equiseti]|uniref:Rho-type gtpase-activating protein n=1 Tax=Fusarium equiseti TaxID=61235 RepID=A0ABQ8RM38_FUSEQ|nr:Rho-type gtpase-activating protein [Fusarium equiseti]
MASIVEDYLESPGMEQETDDVFPCKGCGEILEEGKAFELAGNRWHLDCFRCNTCGTLLDSDANLLLLGDGSLICNNCTYSCSACGNKIEDLAILTGEQAFCATCFRCRNCKRKIENLRYARTSQGIFCMGCHETLMARRRKKSKAAAAAKAREKEHSPMITEKSLPALPANAIPPNAFSNDRVDPDSDTATELSPRPRNHTRHESSSRSSSRPARSPERKPDGLNLPSTTYRSNRNSTMVSRNENNTNDDGFLISVALDPSPHPTPKSTSDNLGEGKSKDGDYFGSAKPSSEKRNDSRTSTPHIAFQSKGRQASTSEHDIPPKLPDRKHSKSSQRESAKPSPAIDEQKTSGRRPPTEDFKLQEAPKSKKLLSRSSSQSSSIPAETNSVRTSNGQPSKAGQGSLPHSDSNATTPASRSSLESRYLDEEELRASMDSSTRTSSRPENAKPLARKDVPSSSGRNANGSSRQQSRQESPDDPTPTRQTPSRSISEQKKTYTQPRSAPAPPGSQNRGQKDENGEPKVSPKLPRWSSGGDFSMDEDMARILGTDEGSTSILRRVSNAVRHGRTGSVESPNQMHSGNRHTRSISETTRATGSPRWPRTPVADDYHAQDISSPMSLTSGDDPAFLKRQLRNSEQRVAELERQFTTEKDLKSLNRKLVEKRKTVSVLDTQTEIMIRQLEVLAGYVERAKETKTPVDPRDLEESAIKEFVQKLDKVKSAMSAAIEQLHEERDLLCEEKDQAIADRDRALLEFEQLSSKNAQLADMNNDLTHQIQERFKSQIGGDIKSPGALGIYGAGKGLNASSLNLDAASLSTGATLVPADEEPIVEAGPTVVQVRKGQAKKFNWKKGSKGLAQGVAKGVNRAVVAFQNDRERMQQQGGLSGENIGMPYNMTVAQVEAPAGAPSNGHVTHEKHSTASALAKKQEERERERQGFGFFGKKNAMPKSGSAGTMNNAEAAEPATVLFGSDLAERADHERRQIPSVVTRCIEEVELRGMDQEGIYRKTGGNSQVNMIKDGFSKDENFDISDPDLDITAVTSVLKQYFRKLPVPLLTFDVYERVLESNAIVDEEERSDHLRKTFASMPQRHRDCLEFLMFHLARVAQREPENLMSPKNLAVVFAPTIMRDTSLEREMTDMHAKNLAIQFVIENSNTIFEDA